MADSREPVLGATKYFRISVTNRCNFSCFYCHREGDNSDTPSELSPDEICLACRTALEFGFRKFKLTGGEPTLHPRIFDIISQLSRLGLPDLSIITNGSTLAECAEPLWAHGLRRLNVTLNTLRQERLNGIQAAPRFSIPVSRLTDGIDKALAVGFRNIKINFVYVDSSSSRDLEDLLAFTGERNLMLVVLPVIHRDRHDTLEDLYRKLETYGIAQARVDEDAEGIRRQVIRLQTGNTVLLRHDELAARQPYSFCRQCRYRADCREGIFPLRLSATGELVPCLANPEHRISIRSALAGQDEEAVRAAFEAARRLFAK